jgi:hypothetical protein
VNSPSSPNRHNSDDSVTGCHNWRSPGRHMQSSCPRCDCLHTHCYVHRYTRSFLLCVPPGVKPRLPAPCAQSPLGSAPKTEGLLRGHHCEHLQFPCNSPSSESYSNDLSLERCATTPPSPVSPHDSLPDRQQSQLAWSPSPPTHCAHMHSSDSRC